MGYQRWRCDGEGTTVKQRGFQGGSQASITAPLHVRHAGHSAPPPLRDRPAPADWERFVSLFTPLLRRWAVRLGVREADAEDLLQELFVILIRKLPEFRYDPTRSFRAWLWTVFQHAVLAWRKRQPQAGPALEQLAELSAPDSLAEATDAEYRRYLLGRITQIVQTDFPPATWQIFRSVAIEGRPGSKSPANSASP